MVASQKKYIDDVDPDFVKIMSDGFFGHPSVCKKLITTVDDLKEIKSVGPNDPWITKQVSYVKEICDYAGKDIYKFYNIFSPLQYIRLRFEEYDEDMEKFVRLFKENPYVMTEAARNIAEDIKCLIKRLYEETDIDGIFYSVQAVQSNDFDHNVHRELVEPLDLELLNYMNHFSTNVILHICGYGKYTNTLDWYKEYPAAQGLIMRLEPYWIVALMKMFEIMSKKFLTRQEQKVLDLGQTVRLVLISRLQD